MQVQSAARLLSAFLAAVAIPAAASTPAIRGIAAQPRRLVVEITGGPARVRLLELRPYETAARAAGRPALWEGTAPQRRLAVPRFDGDRDRLFSKLQLADAATGRPIGPPHWADDLSALPAWDFAMPWPKSIKGVTCPVDTGDVIATGTRYTDFGVLINGVVDWRSLHPAETWTVDGRAIGIDTGFVGSIDAQVKAMTDAGINVTLIPVMAIPDQPEPANPMIDARTDLAGAPNHLGAFNLTTEDGLLYYRAAIEYLAHRYSDPSRAHGWVLGYVIGNEVQSHWYWHNMGRATTQEVADEYALALRLAWLAIRRFHSGVRVYASLDHCWTTRADADPLKSTQGRDLLEAVNDRIRAEGDFPWNLAFHPYPENLFEPRFWLDKLAVMGFNTPKITFRNLEVLPAYLAQSRFLYKGQPRRIILSEQGFHCPDGPDGEKVQAAAYAYAYYKVSRMPTVDAFILHRHVDHRAEGGLRLGMWSCRPDGPDPCSPDRARLIHEVYRAADTDGWREAFAFAQPIIGLRDWAEAAPRVGPIPARSPEVAPPPDPRRVVCDLGDLMAAAETRNNLVWQPSWERDAGGRLCPTIFQHPNGAGYGDAAFTIALPAAPRGQRLVLRFAVAVVNPVSDGVVFQVRAEGRRLWGAVQMPGRPTDGAVDLTAYAGRTVKLTLRVGPRGNNAGDWAHWLRPVILREPRP